MTSALQTDHYELTMLEAALRSGVADRRAVFEVFARRLPAGRRYGVVAGVGRLAEAIDAFRFGRAEIDFLRGAGFDDDTLDWLAAYRFRGDVLAYREGELYFPGSPVVTVEGSFGESVILETLVLSVLNHDSAVASAASRMVDVAGGRPLIEMGGRRTHEDAAVAAARAAYVAGFDATSNLEAGRRFGIPTRGTAAHAFTMAHADEAEAFASQLDSAGTDTILLVDTYDIPTAIRTGVRLANERGAAGPGGVRIDSGDLAVEAEKARALLDELGASTTRIVVSGDLDEHRIEELLERGAPIDSFGIGTSVVTGSGHPTAGFVYKLVAITDDAIEGTPLRPVAKRSEGKASIGGRKAAWRILDDAGHALAEHVVVHGSPADAARPRTGRSARPLHVPLIVGGAPVHPPALADVRAHHRSARLELPAATRALDDGPPAMTATFEPSDPRSTS